MNEATMAAVLETMGRTILGRAPLRTDVSRMVDGHFWNGHSWDKSCCTKAGREVIRR